MMMKQNNDKHYVHHVRYNPFTIDIHISAQRILEKLLVQKHIYFLILHFNGSENDNKIERTDEQRKNEKAK